ncbi:MAG: trypsin-like peptidase domain-containing protein [Opitutaceae bacterium]|nr:trypsin-like peptidase domain-containing protein [Opitutaceae bacterium]
MNPFLFDGPAVFRGSVALTLVASLMIAASCLRGQAADVAANPATPVEQSVVKIFATSRQPDYYRPWQKQAPREGTGTGIVIEGRRILTSAHVVLYASQIQVQAHQSGDKLSAQIEYLAPGIDLAVLKLDDESFFKDHPALPRTSRLPLIKDTVMAYGYPAGGTSLSITKGIVSRIEYLGYSSSVSGLRIQIDAAINPGNSGGPALVGDKVVGLAFQRLGRGDNIGYIIPTEEIELFLEDVKDGTYDGKPALYDDLQNLTNPALRAYLKLDKTVEGIVVSSNQPVTPDNPLRAWDVITRVGDESIDNEGMIKVGNGLRLQFLYHLQRLGSRDTAPLTVVRSGKVERIDAPLLRKRKQLMPDIRGEYPSYFIYGPMSFVAVSTGFLSNAPLTASANGDPIITRRGDAPAFDGEQLVAISAPFFPHRLAKGYPNPLGRSIKRLNSVEVRNLRHLVELLRDNRDEFLVFEFAGRGADTLVFSRKECQDATEEILADNNVRAQASSDLMRVWKTTAP